MLGLYGDGPFKGEDIWRMSPESGGRNGSK